LYSNVTAGIVVECDEASTFEADPLTDEDIQAEFNHSADANEEEEEEMDEDEIVIVDEPPKPPTQCELRHAIGVTCAKVRSPQNADHADCRLQTGDRADHADRADRVLFF